MQEEIVLSVDALTVSFDSNDGVFTAVDNTSFKIGRGETLAIVGESGSGKSLTALALVGLLPGQAKVQGRIILQANGRVSELTHLTTSKAWQELRGQEIGMVFQEPMSSLNPVMKVGKQVSEAIRNHQRVDAGRAKQLAIEWLGKVQLPEPEKLYERFPHQLSGGQKQRVMIAMAMCNNPALLIADEPTTALDVTVQKDIIQLMTGLQREQGTAMIFITHDLALAAEKADKVMVMYRGQVKEYGTTTEVLEHPKDEYTKALLACRPSAQAKGKRLPVVSDFINAGQQPAMPAYPAIATGDVLLKVNDLRVWFTEHSNWLGRPKDYFKAVDGVSFELRRGEVLGLVGESGCGKSTISRSLMGLLPVNDGQAIFDGKDLAKIGRTEWADVRRQIQMIFQDPFASLNPRMTIGDILGEPMRVHHIVPKTNVRAEVKRLLDQVHLPADSLKRYPHQFSGGQRQRIGIARALAMRPQLIICDESVSALDISMQAQILNLLKELQAEFHLSYLFVSHDLSVVHYMSDRVMVMQAGKIVESGDANQILKQPANVYTQRLLAAMPGHK